MNELLQDTLPEERLDAVNALAHSIRAGLQKDPGLIDQYQQKDGLYRRSLAEQATSRKLAINLATCTGFVLFYAVESTLAEGAGRGAVMERPSMRDGSIDAPAASISAPCRGATS